MAPRGAREGEGDRGARAAEGGKWTGFRPNDHLVEPFAAPFHEGEVPESPVTEPVPEARDRGPARWWRRLFGRRD